MKPTIYIGADHAGFDMKEMIKEHLELTGYTVEDLGAHQFDPNDDYPEYAGAVAQAVSNHEGSLGILSCGNAEGVCIVANKFTGIRAGLGFSEEAAKTMRSDDDANIICIPGRLQIEDDPLGIVAVFLTTPFSGALRHIRRLLKIASFEKNKNKKPIAIVPAILVHNQNAFLEKINQVEIQRLASIYQVDVLDHTLIAQTSYYDAEQIAKITSLPNFELHLMVNNPLPIIEQWCKFISTLKRVIIHAEIPQNLRALIKHLKTLEHLEIGIAINPETPISVIDGLEDKIDLLLIMGVQPGASGQTFIGQTILKKIKEAHFQFPALSIAVDGGITPKNAKKIIHAGAGELCVGSAIWESENPEKTFLALGSP